MQLVVATAMAPMVVFALVAALMVAAQQREETRHDAIGRARAAMSAVDAHLRGAMLSLGTLAVSKSLENRDVAAFHEESQRVLRTQPAWENIGLASAAKTQLSNAVEPFARPVPIGNIDDSFEAVLRGAKAGFSDVMPGPAVLAPTVRVRIPVTYGEEVRYVISAPLNLRHLNALLEAQGLPHDWEIALIDRHQRVIAREPEAPVGVEVPQAFRDEIRRAPQGWFRGQTLDERSAYVAYVTSELTGWVLGISIPAEEVEAGERRTYAIIGFGFVFALAAAMLFATIATRDMHS